MHFARFFIAVILGLLLMTEPATGARRCPRRVAAARETVLPSLEPFDDVNWDQHEKFLANFAPFSRILTLADSCTVDDARRIAGAYSATQVIGSDLDVIIPDPKGRFWFDDEVRELPNLTVMPIDVTKRFPLEDNSVELVYLRSGICYCEKKKESCCGIPRQKVPVLNFLREAWRVLDKRQPHSMVFLDGYQEPEIERVWLEACGALESELPVSCRQLFDSRSDTRGFKLLVPR